jgi:hypothetical protein
MRHLAAIFVLLVLAGIAVVVIRSILSGNRRQKRAARRGMRIRITEDGTADKPTDLKED